MERFVKVTYIIIVVLFLVAMSVLGWFIIDERRATDTEIAFLRKIIEENTLPKSDKKIETPDDVIIIREFEYNTPTEGYMKIIAFDNESKVVWTYKSNMSDLPEYSFDMLWPHYECVYSLEATKMVILNTFTGEVRAEVKLGEKDTFVAAGYYKDNVYALVNEGDYTQKIYRIDKDGHIVSSKQLSSPVYDSFDQTVERVEMPRIDENEIEIFITRYDKENIEAIIDRTF